MAWQGGEATLTGIDFFRRSVELQRKYGRPGMPARVWTAVDTKWDWQTIYPPKKQRDWSRGSMIPRRKVTGRTLSSEYKTLVIERRPRAELTPPVAALRFAMLPMMLERIISLEAFVLIAWRVIGIPGIRFQTCCTNVKRSKL